MQINYEAASSEHLLPGAALHEPKATARTLSLPEVSFGLNSLFLFSLFYFMLPSLSFLDFLQHISQCLVMREAQSSQNPLFYYVIAVCLRSALSFQLSAGIAGMHMVPEVYSFYFGSILQSQR